MAERRENSVLFSLSELRKIEEDRIRQEDDARKAAAEAARRAQEEAMARAAAEEERKRKDAEEFAMRERLEKEKLAHEANHKIQEVERRARVEADAKLREQQMHLEMQMKHKAPPIKAIVTVVGILFAIVCGLGYYMYNQHQTEKAQQDAIIAQKAKEAEIAKAEADKQARELAALQKELGELQNQLNKATTDAERKAIQARMNEVKARHASGTNGSKTVPAGGPKVNIGGDTSDPLNGIK